ncbi:MAG: aminotransferase class I/II-fold pyridoxal phosphate-dependent enzyme [Hyphomonadaceae bacterium]|nr:aminotransferase class I/II-fold pyridoxal phosphate-dependent enzyme [Hyphomonadaceae bacterium]
MPQPSQRSAVAPFLAMEMAREASALQAQGRSIVRFDVGQPARGAPQSALDAARAAVAQGDFPYTDALGLPALRRKLSAWYRDAQGCSVAPERIVITTGASGAFTLAFLALFDPGDRLLMAAPGYPPYRHIASALGLSPVIAEATAAERMQLQARHVAAALRDGALAGALIASPANPTGTMLRDDEVRALAAACADAGAALISDEIYHGLTYAAPARSALTASDDVVVVNSFSKYWAMTGWRVGWMVVPDRLIDRIERLSQNLTICPPTPSQIAACAALDARDDCEAARAAYARNRGAILEALPGLGVSLAAPADGAFYMLLDISAHSADSLDFCRHALRDAGVALTTGLDFDEARGARWVRLAYARDAAEVAEGIARLNAWLAR